MMDKGAVFNLDRTRRYSLWRIWNRERLNACFIGLNPSTADETQDDATIRRCIGFSMGWGAGGIMVVNLFADIATRPTDIHPLVAGDNIEAVYQAARDAGIIVAAWGRLPYGWVGNVVIALQSRLKDMDVFCLGKNQDGSPKHPLYLPRETRLEPFWTARPKNGN